MISYYILFIYFLIPICHLLHTLQTYAVYLYILCLFINVKASCSDSNFCLGFHSPSFLAYCSRLIVCLLQSDLARILFNVIHKLFWYHLYVFINLLFSVPKFIIKLPKFRTCNISFLFNRRKFLS